MMAERAMREGCPPIGMPLALQAGERTDRRSPDDHRWCRLAREEVFVASSSAVEKEHDGGVVSYRVRNGGVLALLPETNKVLLAREESAAALGDRRRVVEVVGRLSRETDDDPARYRTMGFPDDDALAAIGMGDIRGTGRSLISCNPVSYDAALRTRFRIHRT
ncbi:MAG: hypothetical protein JWN86_3350 [Planctomycetota bacterium]|nr:hypothetical protein [Planctomycetota bacterium]